MASGGTPLVWVAIPILARALAPLGVSFLVATSDGYTLPFILLVGVAGGSMTLAGAVLTGRGGQATKRSHPHRVT